MLGLLGININVGQADNPFSMLIWFINLLFLIILAPVFLPVLIKSMRLENSAKKIFRNAARMIFSSTDGFTSRPFTAGSTDFSKEQIIITYCNNPSCNTSRRLAGFLLNRGFENVFIFFAGFDVWKDNNLPVEAHE